MSTNWIFQKQLFSCTKMSCFGGKKKLFKNITFQQITQFVLKLQGIKYSLFPDIHYGMQPGFFSLCKFSHFSTWNMILTHTKEFCEKFDTNLQGFEKIKIETTRFLQQVPTSRVKYKRVLKVFYFHIWSIAKFGCIFLWMIASLATSQNWRKNTYICNNWRLN
jgi:hypothetical protein